MVRRLGIYITALVLLVGIEAFADDNITITMQVSPDTIGLTDQATLVVTISGNRQSYPTPSLPNLSVFEYYSQGTSTNISIVNGEIQSSLRYQYLLAPKRKGTFVIKPAVIVIDQKRYESNEVILTVLEQGVATPQSVQDQARNDQGDNRDVFMVASVDKEKIYVNEQVTLSIKFYNAVRLYSQPSYTAPQTTDFWAEVLEPQKTYYETINGRRYKAVEINTALFPTRSGELTIGPARIDVTVAGRRDSQRNNPFSLESFFDRGEPMTVRSRPLTVEVMPLPAEGKPADYSGTVGNFTIRSTADKLSTEVNQPITVTYKISGTGNIKTIAEPKIEDLKDFRVYRASTSEKISKIDNVVGGTKIFEEVFIPKKAGKLTIPSVSLSFFDPKGKRYRTITTDSITVNVKQAENMEYAEVPYQAVPGRVINPEAKDIRYIKSDPGKLEGEKALILFSPRYLALNSLPVIILAGVIVMRKRREKLAVDIGYARSRSARKMAQKRLGKARKLRESGRPDEFYAELRQAVISYVADKTNRSPYGFTSDMLLELLQEKGAGEEILGDLRELFRRADFAQYSSGADIAPEQNADSLRRAENILVRLEGTRLG